MINLDFDEKEVYIIVTDFIKTYINNSGCKKVVIGLSGGIDSALAAVLCSKALGKQNVLCLFLQEETTPKDDIKHVNDLSKKFNLNVKKIDITPLIKEAQKYCIIKPDKMALANIKARIRMALLFEYANMTSSLVCGTSNKSEFLIGYFTKYGDGGTDIQPIGDLYKTQIYQLSRFLKLPKDMIEKSPSAGLWHGQSDEQELGMKYETLDKILYALEYKLDFKKVAKEIGVKVSDIERIRQMRVKSQHKRRLPLIPKVGYRTPGLDWRDPIQEG